MKKSIFLLFSIIFVLSLAGVLTAAEDGSMEGTEPMIAEQAPADGSGMKASDSSDWGVHLSARAQVTGTDPESTVKGTADFVETGGGIVAVINLTGVTPAGKHGIHIHENGSCDDGGKAAGGHFNPASVKHGLLPKDGAEMAHAGDMGNIEINATGSGMVTVFLPDLSLTQGETNIIGKAVILHEKEDDFGQPTGNAGGRIGCGVIDLNN